MRRSRWIVLALFVSADAALAQWSAVTSPGGTAPIGTYLPTPHGLVAGTDDGRVFSSLDHGASWALVGGSLGEEYAPVVSLAFLDEWLIASRTGATDVPNIRSFFDGTSWSPWVPIPAPDETMHWLTVAGSSIFGVISEGIVRSEDLGATWASVTQPSGSVARIFAHGGRLFASEGLIGSGDLFRSDDDGASWTAVTGSLPSSFVCSQVTFRGELLVDVYHGGGIGTLWRSGDAGASWTFVSSLPSTSNINGMTVTSEDRLAIGTSGSFGSSGTIFVTTDLEDWLDVTGDLPAFAHSVNDLVSHEGWFFKTGGSVVSYRSPEDATVSAGEGNEAFSPVALDVRPQPARDAAWIAFDLPAEGRVDAGVFDALGRRVATVHTGWLSSGHHTLLWDGRSDAGDRAAAGMYIVRISTLGVAEQRKLIVME